MFGDILARYLHFYPASVMAHQYNVQSTYSQYLSGGGEMGELTRSFDWSKTILGTPDGWSQSLLTTVSIILNSKFPMFLWWGPELIQFYNDAYRPSLGEAGGKHPKALGQRGEDCWQEIWPVIKPLIDQVLAGGDSIWSEDQLIPIYRNGELEDVYWTFGYSKVPDETGKPAAVLVICNETTEKVRSYNSVIEAKNELEFALEASDLGTWDLNPATGKFIGNKRLKSWFGLSSENEIPLDHAIAIMADKDRERVVAAIQKAIERGSDGNYNITYNIINPNDGTRRVVEATGKAKFDADGNAYRFSGILQDVTEEFLLQQRKDEFISVASHELKTPITTLNASMQILQRMVKTNAPTEKMAMFVDKASNNLNKLMRLLDDLLNVTKIQQGQLALNKTMFNLAELVRDSCEYIQMSGEHEFEIGGDKEVMVFGDYRRLDQVIVNLLNNAVKYSPFSKKVEITISHDEHNAKVSVRDYGIGINPQKLPHLFDRYYRVDALGHQFSGLGLGLYICSEIINRHNGKIGVESELGNGSNFWFTIPLDEE
jgi:signal transduction histidine kinase